MLFKMYMVDNNVKDDGSFFNLNFNYYRNFDEPYFIVTSLLVLNYIRFN